MKKYKLILITSLVLAASLISACSLTGTAPEQTQPVIPTATDTPATISPTDEPAPSPDGEDVDPAQSETRVIFEQLGISLEVPEGLYVQKDPIVSYDDPSKLESYLFYIQNYGSPDGPPSGNFQIYGHVQFNLPAVSWEQYKSDILNSEMYEYAREIEVNGQPGLDTQFTGQRNRFVFHFILDGQVLTLAVSDPTEVNKALADQIINTLEFTPGSVTDASGVQLITEPNGYYQMYLPDDWEVTFNSTAGVRLSDLQASSPDREVVVEESDGPHDNIYYKNGMMLSVVVLEDDSALAEPVMAQVQRSVPLMIAGIEGMDYTFREPSTAEGEIREVRFYHNNLSYLVRFSYAMNADGADLDWLIRNFQIAQ